MKTASRSSCKPDHNNQTNQHRSALRSRSNRSHVTGPGRSRLGRWPGLSRPKGKQVAMTTDNGVLHGGEPRSPLGLESGLVTFTRRKGFLLTARAGARRDLATSGGLGWFRQALTSLTSLTWWLGRRWPQKRPFSRFPLGSHPGSLRCGATQWQTPTKSEATQTGRGWEGVEEPWTMAN